jgi:thiol-disulfide isomerase/thioredoxin
VRWFVPLLLALATLTGCGLSGTNQQGYITGDGRVTQWVPSHRGAPIVLTGTALDGKHVDVSTDRGKVVVVNIWWSGCGPCRSEMPMLQAVSKQGTAAFVGINTRDNSADNGLAFERSVGADYPSIYAPDGQALSAFKGLPGTTPVTVVLDRQGRMAAVVSGPIPSQTTLEDLITCAGDDNAPHCGQKA